MFKRKIYSKLLDWKNESNGNTALLIEGARRIGKSTVVEEFGKKKYESYILIDFATASKTVKELFEDKVCPIEIKSSGYKAHASLDAFTQKFSDRILWRYLVYTKDFFKDEDIICLPVYMVPFL